jgi:signal transduction histidine kinase
LRYTLLYFGVVILYLLFSTIVAEHFAKTVGQYASIELVKGTAFMAASALFFGVLVWVGLAHLSRKNAELAAMQDALVISDRNALVGQFAAAIAHDMNNLLTIVQGSVELLGYTHAHNGGGEDSQTSQDLKVALDGLTYLAKQMMRTGKVGVAEEREDTLPLKITENLIRLAKSHPRIGSASITLNHDGDMGPFPLCRVIYQQMVGNLLLNAADSADATDPRILVNVVRTHEALTVEVHDNGPGITPGKENEIFEPFYTTKGPGGSGLGLITVKACAQLHNGHVEVGRSVSLGGAEFSVILPAPRELVEQEIRRHSEMHAHH